MPAGENRPSEVDAAESFCSVVALCIIHMMSTMLAPLEARKRPGGSTGRNVAH